MNMDFLMSLEFLWEFLSLVVVGICLCVGWGIKHVIPDKRINKFIPIIVALLGLVLNLWVNGWLVTPEIVLGGLFSGLASTGLHQAFSKLLNKKQTEAIETTTENVIENTTDENIGTTKLKE